MVDRYYTTGPRRWFCAINDAVVVVVGESRSCEKEIFVPHTNSYAMGCLAGGDGKFLGNVGCDFCGSGMNTKAVIENLLPFYLPRSPLRNFPKDHGTFLKFEELSRCSSETSMKHERNFPKVRGPSLRSA